jgi:hypothetical protein
MEIEKSRLRGMLIIRMRRMENIAGSSKCFTACIVWLLLAPL